MCFNQDYRDKSISNIQNLIDDVQFKSRNTSGEQGFTRKRKLTFQLLLIIIGQGMVRSLQRELNRFFGIVRGQHYDIHEVTAGALTQARAKLKPGAFIEMNAAVIPDFYEYAPYKIWKRHRLLAVDGSTLNLPAHPSVEKEFGVHYVGPNADVKRSMARISICYDVLNLLTLDSRIAGFNTCEKTLLKDHLGAVAFKADDLLLLDRGYPGIALMYELQHLGIHFCIRMTGNWWKEVDKMLREGETDREVFFPLPAKDRGLQSMFGSPQQGVRCRLAVVVLDTGEKEILCTSLLDRDMYTSADMKELYHYRWNVEEAYKLYKCRAGLEVFSGKTANSVKQDFHAKVFMMTMCAILSFPIEQKVREEAKTATTRHVKKINRTNAVAACRNGWAVLWLKAKTKKLLMAFDKMLEKSTDIVRPGRKFKRKHKQKSPPAMNYKQL